MAVEQTGRNFFIGYFDSRLIKVKIIGFSYAIDRVASIESDTRGNLHVDFHLGLLSLNTR